MQVRNPWTLMDGYQVATRLRRLPVATKVLLIALTAYEEGAASLKRAGFDHHQMKPTQMQKLSALLATYDAAEIGP